MGSLTQLRGTRLLTSVEPLLGCSTAGPARPPLPPRALHTDGEGLLGLRAVLVVPGRPPGCVDGALAGAQQGRLRLALAGGALPGRAPGAHGWEEPVQGLRIAAAEKEYTLASAVPCRAWRGRRGARPPCRHTGTARGGRLNWGIHKKPPAAHPQGSGPRTATAHASSEGQQTRGNEDCHLGPGSSFLVGWAPAGSIGPLSFQEMRGAHQWQSRPRGGLCFLPGHSLGSPLVFYDPIPATP